MRSGNVDGTEMPKMESECEWNANLICHSISGIKKGHIRINLSTLDMVRVRPRTLAKEAKKVRSQRVCFHIPPVVILFTTSR